MPASWRKQRRLALLLPTSITTFHPYPRQQGLVALSQALLGFWAPQEDFGVWMSVPCRSGSLQELLSRESTSYPLVFPTSHANACRFMSGFPPLPSTPLHSGCCSASHYPCGSTVLAPCHSRTNSEAAAPPGPQILPLPTAAESFVYRLA